MLVLKKSSRKIQDLLVISLAALISCQSSKKLKLDSKKESPNFKSAIRVIRRYLDKIVGVGSIPMERTQEYAEVMVEEVGRILWKKQPGRSYPRVSKQPINK